MFILELSWTDLSGTLGILYIQSKYGVPFHPNILGVQMYWQNLIYTIYQTNLYFIDCTRVIFPLGQLK